MSEPTADTLGAYLKRERERADLSVRQLADRIGVHMSYISRLEKGQRHHAKPERLQQIAKELGVDAADILRYVGVESAALLPSTRTYFRRKLGVDAEEADILAKLVEDYQAKRKEGGNENTNHHGD